MTNKTKKQLADAICMALLNGEYLIKDSNDGSYFERLGYIVTNDTWMHDDALDVGEGSIEHFLKGAMHVIDSSLKPQGVEDKTLTFEYTEPDTPDE